MQSRMLAVNFLLWNFYFYENNCDNLPAKRYDFDCSSNCFDYCEMCV